MTFNNKSPVPYQNTIMLINEIIWHTYATTY